jgi:hypothetical protein
MGIYSVSQWFHQKGLYNINCERALVMIDALGGINPVACFYGTLFIIYMVGLSRVIWQLSKYS